MTGLREELIELLRDRLILDHGLRDELGSPDDWDWTVVGPAIEAESKYRRVRVDRGTITVTSKRHNSVKTIPLE